VLRWAARVRRQRPRRSHIQERAISALINAAGILVRAQDKIPTFIKLLEVNLTGTFRTCMAFHSALAQSKRSTVNIASMSATLASASRLIASAKEAS
jgi:NAD(P)-dependent dehydrogenase (short-subunit alcohol dehydrogenase family)